MQAHAFFQEIGIQPKNNHIFRFNPNPQAYDSVLPLIRVSFKYAIQMILYILQGDRIRVLLLLNMINLHIKK
jgi:hypothetical protein